MKDIECTVMTPNSYSDEQGKFRFQHVIIILGLKQSELVP